METSSRGEITRNEIIGAALRLFSQRGFFSTSTRDLLEAVSLSKGAFYYYFKSKASLVSTLLGETRREVEREIIGPVRNQARPEASFRLAMDQVIRRHENGTWRDGRFLCRIMQESAFQSGSWSDLIRETVHPILEFWQETIDEGQQSGSIRQDLDSRVLAELAFNIMISSSGTMEMVPDSPSVQQMAEFLIQVAER